MPGVNIVYPINGETYPKRDPVTPVVSAYFTSSFAVTCSGGPHTVKWGFDSPASVLGKATFYDEISVQFTHKLPKGNHFFWVDAGSCGKARVRFIIG